MTLKDEIVAREAEFMQCFNSGNAQGAAAIYAEDCKIMPHGKEVGIGRQAAEHYFKQDMQEGVKTVELKTEEVNGQGDWCFERGSYKLDGSRGQETGAYLLVWKKAGGKWYIYNDCFNVIKPAQG